MGELGKLEVLDFRRDALLPPCDENAERDVVSALLFDEKAIARVATELKPSDFYLGGLGKIYAVIQDLYWQGKPIGLNQVALALRAKDEMEEVGGVNALSNLAGSSFTSISLESDAEIVAQMSRRRQAISVLQKASANTHDLSQDPKKVLGDAVHELSSISTGGRSDGLKHIGEVVLDVFQQVSQVMDGAVPPGILSGFYDLDEMTGGFQPGELLVLGGRPGTGKTAWLCQVATHIARSQPVLIFSLEMTKEELAQRIISNMTGVPASEMQSGSFSDGGADFFGAAEKVSGLELWICDDASLSIQDMETIANNLATRNGKSFGMVCIDYLQLMGGKGFDRVQQLASITRRAKGAAKRLGSPVLLLSQINRGVEDRSDKRPTPADLKGSGAIEQDADLVALLYREECHDAQTTQRGIAELIIGKFRRGPTGTVKLLFEPEFTRFKNLAGSRGGAQ